MKKTIIAATTFALLTSSGAIADGDDHGKKHPDLDFRHHTMETIKDNMGAMLAIMQGKGNAADFDVYAEALAANAAGFYTVAKHKEKGGETLEAAWENYGDFSSRISVFVKDARALADLPADADMAARGAALKQVGSNCKACHDKYRKEH